MLMTYCEGDWLMRMPDHEDIHRENAARQTNGDKKEPVSEMNGGREEARALQDFARRMDTVMLGWMRKAHLKEGDQ